MATLLDGLIDDAEWTAGPVSARPSPRNSLPRRKPRSARKQTEDLIQFALKNLVAGIENLAWKKARNWARRMAPGDHQQAYRQQIAEDLFSGAMHACWVAAERYKYQQARFTTFAGHYIMWGMQEAAKSIGRVGNNWSDKAGIPRGKAAVSLDSTHDDAYCTDDDAAIDADELWATIRRAMVSAGIGRDYRIIERLFRRGETATELSARLGIPGRVMVKRIRRAIEALRHSDEVARMAVLHGLSFAGLNSDGSPIGGG